MNSLNQIILEGNVCRQPELKQSAAGTYVCVMPLAVNRSYKNARGENTAEVSFFDIATFGKTAEVCSKYATIGRHIRIVGRIKQDRWKNLEGKSQSKVSIIAEHVELLNLPRGRQEAAGGQVHKAEETLVAANMAAARQQLEEDSMDEEVPAF